MSENLEVQIGRLDERFKALEKKVDTGNKILLDELKEIKDNFALRLSHVEEDVEWLKNRMWLAIGVVAVVEPLALAIVLRYINN